MLVMTSVFTCFEAWHARVWRSLNKRDNKPQIKSNRELCGALDELPRLALFRLGCFFLAIYLALSTSLLPERACAHARAREREISTDFNLVTWGVAVCVCVCV